MLELVGAFNKNPARKAKREAEPVENKPLQVEPPAYLPKKIKEIWTETLSRLVPGVALQSDFNAFERLCRMTYEDRKGRLTTAGRNLLTRLEREFGMTPSSRSQVKVYTKTPPAPERDADSSPSAKFFA